MYMGQGIFSIWVPKRLILEHCSQHDHLFCVPSSLLFECYDELVREAWARRGVRVEF